MPEDFGTLAVLGIFLAISTQLADIGFGSSLTRSERVDDADLSTIFYYNIGMSSLLYLILFIAAPWIADYFRNPILVSVLRVISLSVVINRCMVSRESWSGVRCSSERICSSSSLRECSRDLLG